MARFIRSRISNHMTEQAQIDALRQALQDRVTDNEWTITEDEATAMLQSAPAHLLLEAFNLTSVFLKVQKRDHLKWYDQNDTLEIIQRHIAEVLLAFPPPPTAERDLPRSYKWKHTSNRVAEGVTQ